MRKSVFSGKSNIPTAAGKAMVAWIEHNRAALDRLRDIAAAKRATSLSQESVDSWYLREVSKIPGYGSWLPETIL